MVNQVLQIKVEKDVVVYPLVAENEEKEALIEAGILVA